jgi:hypothetical protein
VNTLQAATSAEGAIVDILIGLPAAIVQSLRKAGRPIPQPLALRALLDTGAEATCADPTVLAPLVIAGNLPPTRFLLANVPATGGLTGGTEYQVSLTVLHPSGNVRRSLVPRTWDILELSLGPLGYQAIVGRDVLERCVLVYDGPSATFTLGF